ncbi:hypothetical protein SAMN05444401_0770 [Clostridium amylolyticum]|uniref:Uncharacterized protein n=1 Tax=Clostridium amylolyticum TaxID=1121298 RepID=A0A1M6BH29_9CLOT|nr:hypothetical protein [Clostridium amylolyticum]SHI48080.1 hypothetical protein SAMN05444401_0770 [Clostridium amylolyticum]
MSKLYYCLDCKRVFQKEEQCEYCSSNAIKEIRKDSPVNILGTKIKGRVLKIEPDAVRLLLTNEFNERYIKDYKAEELKKVL